MSVDSYQNKIEELEKEKKLLEAKFNELQETLSFKIKEMETERAKATEEVKALKIGILFLFLFFFRYYCSMLVFYTNFGRK